MKKVQQGRWAEKRKRTEPSIGFPISLLCFMTALAVTLSLRKMNEPVAMDPTPTAKARYFHEMGKDEDGGGEEERSRVQMTGRGERRRGKAADDDDA